MKRKKAPASPSRKAPKKRLIPVPRRGTKKVARKMAKKAVHKAIAAHSPRMRFALSVACAAGTLAGASQTLVASLERRASLRAVAAGLVVSIVIMGTTAGVLRSVSAATYTGPSQAAPGGNIPFTIWNRTASTVVQPTAAIAIDGGGPGPATSTGVVVGLNAAITSTLDLGNGGAGQNVYYGAATYAGMNAGDSLFKLETYAAGFTTRFNVDRDGSVSASGNMNSSACFGPTFQGSTATSYDGTLNGTGTGYINANALCVGTFGAGAHVCSSAEIMNSLKCSSPTSPIRSASWNDTDGVFEDAWIQDGPPGFTAPANDCGGWRSSAGTSFGRIWRLDATTGGRGFLTTCNQAIQFSCCK